jgi:AcrR family transcriptional regulator
VAGSVKGQRSLRSDLAAHTQARILDAAAEAFVQNGFAGARIEDIAVAAGVAVPTVYKVFTNKRNLLMSALERAMTDSDTAGSVAAQGWWLEQLEEPDPVQQLRLIARNARHIYERSAALLDVLRAAAPLDQRLSQEWDRLQANRLDRSRRTARSLMAKTRRTRMTREEAALTLVTLNGPELYTTYLSAGRTPQQYERWLADLLVQALLDPS